jgi:hypothetical protein
MKTPMIENLDAHQTLVHAIEHLNDRTMNWTNKHVVEFGVASGLSLEILAFYLGGKVPIFGFDSFEGLPEDWAHTECKKGFFSQNGVVPEIENTRIYPGWFEDSVPKYVADHPNAEIALLHLDADLYSSTKTILDGINHMIVPGTIVVCDEWFYCFDTRFDDHEQRAVKEWMATYAREVEFIDVEDTHRCGMERKVFRVTK